MRTPPSLASDLPGAKGGSRRGFEVMVVEGEGRRVGARIMELWQMILTSEGR